MRGAGPAASDPQQGFIGRAAVRQAINDALAVLGEGMSASVVVLGEPGIGKTRLLATIPDDGLRSLRAAGDEIGMLRPFDLVLRAMRSDANLERVVEDLTRLGECEPEHVAIDAIVQVLEVEASSGPLLLVLDDLHWADPSSIRVLQRVAMRLADLPIGLLVAGRPNAVSAQLETILAWGYPASTTRIVLDGLSAEEVGTLTSDVLGDAPGPGLIANLARANGNPFYVIESLSALDADGALDRVGTVIELVGDPLPPSLRLVVARALHSLPRATVDLLELAAVMGATFTVPALAAVTGRPAIAVVADLAPALASGAVVDRGDELGFGHALVQECLYEDVPATVRAALHRDIGRSLMGLRHGRSSAARHLLAGARAGDDATADDLVALADELTGIEIEVQLRSAALDIMSAAHPQRLTTAARVLLCLGMAGRVEEAEEVAERHLRATAPDLARVVRATLVRVYSETMQFDKLHREVAALEELGGVEAEARSEVDALHALAGIWQGDAEGADIVSRRVLDDPRATSLARVCALENLAVLELLRARPDAAIVHAQRAVDVERAAVTESTASLYLAMAMMAADDLASAAQVLETSYRDSMNRGHESAAVFARLTAGIVHLLAGDLESAMLATESGLAHARACGVQPGLVAGHAVAGRVLLHRGELEAARASIAAGDAALTFPGPSIDWFLWARSLVLDACGEDPAVESLSLAWDLTAPIRFLLAYQTIGVDLVRAAMARGDVARAESVCAELDIAASASSSPAAAVAALHGRGLLAGDPAILQQALDGYASGPRRLSEAGAAEDAAAASPRGDAVVLLRRAAALYVAAGAHGDATRVRSALRGLGATLGGRERRPTVGWEALTEAERRIVPLVAAGLTSKAIAADLIVSVYTIDTHLRHIYQKLGIRSRAQLATAWAARSPS